MRNTAKRNHPKIATVRFRRTLLASASLLALGGLVMNEASAQSQTFTLTLPSTRTFATSYALAITPNDQFTFSPSLSATITNVFNGVAYVTSSAVGTPVTVDANSTTATTIGNIVNPNLIDLVLIQPVGGSAGILSSQLRGDPAGASVLSTAAQSAVQFGAVENNQAAAPVTVTNNAALARTTLNQQRSSIEGALPANFASATQGSVVAQFQPGAPQISSTTTSSVGIDSHQTSFNAGGKAGSGASIDTSSVALDLSNTTAGTASSPLTLSTNSISAAFTGNDASNSFNATGGSATFTGSVAINNSQANLETQGAGVAPTASVTTSTITGDIRSRGATLTTLSAPLVVSGNTLSASSTGNAAGTRGNGGITAGNTISIADGVEVTGTGSATTNTLTNGANTINAGVTADLALVNGQGNQGTYFNSQVVGSAVAPLQNGVVVVRADQIGAGGSITQSNNTVSAGSTGNLAGNLISDKTSNFNASVGFANTQSNDATPITGLVQFGSVTANVGSTAGPVTGPITSNNNAISATADGSVAGTSILLDAANLTALANPGPGSSVTSNSAGFGAVSTTSGVSASNLQGNYGAATTIGATVDTSPIAVNIRDQATAGNPLVGLAGGTVTLNQNSISAAATGNSAGTSIAVAGTNGNVQASVGNTQFNGNLISGQNLQSGVTANAGDITAATVVNVTKSNVASSATANDAFNSVQSTVSNLTAGNNPLGATASATVNATGAATSTAAFGVASSQRNEAGVTSLTQNNLAGGAGGSFAAIYGGVAGGTGIAGSTLTASDNTITSDTTGNRVTNQAAVSGTILDTAGNAASNIAGVANSQINAVVGAFSATVDGGSPAVTGAGITYFQALAGSKLTASTNTLAATSLGNQATNMVTASGPDLTSAVPAVASGSVDPTAGTVQNEFSLANVQSDSVSGGRTALVERTTAGISNTGVVASVDATKLTADGNKLLAEARNNDATNTIGLTGFSTLSSGAGLLNQQTSDTAVSANLTNDRIRIRITGGGATPVTNSALVLSNNVSAGLAIGSSATNTLNAGGTDLSGNASLAASGVSAANVVTADYGISNNQTQTGAVSSTVSAPIRIDTPASAVSGGGISISGNTVKATAQATSATSTLTLAATGDASALTGAIGSQQLTTADVTTLVTPEPGTTQSVISADTTSYTNTPVAVSKNTITAQSGQNEAFNTQTVTGANIAGKALAGSTDFSVVNSQTGSGNVGATVLPGLVGVLADLVDTSNVTVDSNHVKAAAGVNNTVNTLALTATSGVSASGTVVNSQTASTGTVTSKVGDVAVPGVSAPASVGLTNVAGAATPTLAAAPVTVSNNTFDSLATRNSATNDLKATGANITGGTGLSGGFTQSFSTVNTQDGSGDVTATSNIGVIGTTVGLSLGSTLTVNNNAATSAANVNTAVNSQTLKATSDLTGSGIVSNNQTSGAVADTVSATMTAGTVGLATAANGASVFSGGPAAVSVNTLTAQAGRNTASNSLDVNAATVTGDPAMAPASLTVQSTQTGTGGVSALNSVGTIGATANSATNNSFAVASNTVSALANSNTATNALGRLSSVISSFSGTEMVDNTQTASGGVVSATVNSAVVGLHGVALDNTPVTVTKNVLNADASRNVGNNSLTVAAPTIGGTAPVGLTPASFTVRSAQTGDGDVTAINTAGLIGATENSAVIGTTFGVVDNSLFASANVNNVKNALTLNAVNALTGTAQISNTQSSGTNAPMAVTATVGGASNVAPAIIGVAPFTSGNVLNAVPVTVSGNVLAAQGGGNTATNTLIATSVNSIGGSVGPTFAVLNTQNNAATVTTTASFVNIGATASSITNGAVSVQGNTVSATSFGNSGTNSISLSLLPGSLNQASALISNSQVNSASLSSTVLGVNIGVRGGSTSGGSAVVSGNSVTALTVGNSASNIISSK